LQQAYASIALIDWQIAEDDDLHSVEQQGENERR